MLFFLSFLAGILAPLSSPCVLVLYPGYLAFLAGTSHGEGQRPRPAVTGIAIACGVLASLLLGGMIFSALAQWPGNLFHRIVIPLIYLLLLVFALILIFGAVSGRPATQLPLRLPARRPQSPLAAAFQYGALFGIIILPCNAAAILVLLALAASATGFFTGTAAFFLYGLGVIFPLLVIACLSQARSSAFIRFVVRHETIIQAGAGLFMLLVAIFSLAVILASLPLG